MMALLELGEVLFATVKHKESISFFGMSRDVPIEFLWLGRSHYVNGCDHLYCYINDSIAFRLWVGGGPPPEPPP